MKRIKLSKNKWFFYTIFILSILSMIRTFIIPLQADEITYFQIAKNILEGRYYQVDNPSTVAPVMPLILAFFYSLEFPELSILIAKIFPILLFLGGLFFLYKFLKNIELEKKIILTIISLTIVNPIGIVFYSSFYPESVLFVCFWGLMYYLSKKEYSVSNFYKIVLLFLLISLTRYLYFILGAIVVYDFIMVMKQNNLRNRIKLCLFICIALMPIILWFKYVYMIELSNLSEISYFNRFKTESKTLYNIKAGLGLIQHEEVNKINGIPAFISLFLPVTGLRDFFSSLLLIFTFILGYILNFNYLSKGIRVLFFALILTMLGLIYAGTGFSRYWLILLPGFLIGFYLFFDKIDFPKKWFIIVSQLICIVYVLNEIRIDILYFERYF
ncbi:hypothetical protein [Zunongwangia atlantica]|uniref:Glycosyltransferase RgtA/B/C/D-like domain-containing protein n=1 Tax=Zunongwangia atlantica 22II14-10F7 TaxID=1185767 RepID=A0A1Y1T1W0_9FLAO|nr:hypothetical protein [Zunongwangia atlantica]ORL44996.1 hypothetical protein IIF7_12815 [Zunongwangia atlantica 22II14-10F7]